MPTKDPRTHWVDFLDHNLLWFKKSQTLFWAHYKMVIELLKHDHFFWQITDFGLLQQSQTKAIFWSFETFDPGNFFDMSKKVFFKTLTKIDWVVTIQIECSVYF